MNKKKYKPLIDKYFYCIWIPLSILLITFTVFSITELAALLIMLATDIFTFYFMFSSLFGYCQLRENTLYVKFGFILKREIKYDDILELKKERGVMTYTMLSLKNALDHITIKYNKYDLIAVSIKNQEEFILELEKKIADAKLKN